MRLRADPFSAVRRLQLGADDASAPDHHRSGRANTDKAQHSGNAKSEELGGEAGLNRLRLRFCPSPLPEHSRRNLDFQNWLTSVAKELGKGSGAVYRALETLELISQNVTH